MSRRWPAPEAHVTERLPGDPTVPLATQLAEENASLRRRLQELVATLESIRRGDVDALVVNDSIYLLESAHASANRLRQDVLAQMEDAVFAFDADEHIVFMNAAAERRYAIGASLALGRHRSEVFSEVPGTGRPETDVLDGAAAGARARAVSTHRLHDGTTLSVESIVSQLLDAAGRAVGSLAVIRDIGSRLEAERAIAEAATALARRERQFATLVENSPDVIARLDRQLRHVYVSPVVEQYTGVPAAAHAGRTHRELGLPQPLCDVWGEALADVFRSGRADRRIKYRLATPSGVTRTFEARLLPEFSDGGEVESVLSIASDVTEREAMDAAMRDSQARLRFILESARIGEWEHDLASDRISASALYGRCFGFEQAPTDWTGALMLTRVHPDDRATVEQSLALSRSERSELHFECRVLWPDGSVHWVEMHGSPYGVDRSRERLLGIVSDITRRKEAEALLRDADRRKDEFLATLAHELRNPLAPITNAIQIMRLSSDSAALENARSIVERQLGQMVHLVDDLLDVSRISRGKVELRSEPTDLLGTLQTALETSRPLIDAGRHHLTVRLSAPGAVRVNGDPTRLSQILSNLLNNAAKYTPEGGRIEVALEVEDGEAVVSVQDSGIGISDEMLPRVFDMFAQVDRTLERSQGGLGIGLALVRKLVELHGGTVGAHSGGDGRGSRFVVRLPLVTTAPGGAASARPKIEASDAGACTILIVDDNRDSATSMSKLMELLGHRTLVAHDGVAAVEMACRHRPDVTLMDIGLPMLNGHDAARKIRAMEGAPEMLLVAISGWGQERDIAKSREAGFNHHFVKPVEVGRLADVIAAYRLSRKRSAT
jgi:PAS domain S-box-containing protein